MFTPPRCPYTDCHAHRSPAERFFKRHGAYWPKCRPQPVPRFQCKVCRRSFSRQTFRVDYRDHKPWLNAPLFMLLVSGIGLRQSGRILSLSKVCTEHKFRKLGRAVGFLHRNLLATLPNRAVLMLDEMETFETCRSTRPLTLPILIERRSMLILAARSAPIRPSGAMPPSRRRRIANDEKRTGRRPHESSRCVRQVLEVVRSIFPPEGELALVCDEKVTYPKIARRMFGDAMVVEQFPGKARRDTRNPLFRINLTNAMARDLTGRLRRRTWLVSKKREFLDLQLNLLITYRNYVRPRFNGERKSPGQRLGFVDRRMTPTEVLGWAQRWGERSPHPLSDGRRTVRQKVFDSAA